jgi:hypothetical protein
MIRILDLGMTPGGSIRNRPCRSEALIAISPRSDPKGLRDGAQPGRRSEQTNFKRDRPLRLIAHWHEIAAIEFGHDKRVRQPGHALATQGHDFQHPRVMGSEDRAGADQCRRRREVVRKNAAKTRVVAVGDEGVGRRIPSAPLNGGNYPWSGDRHEGVGPDQHGGEHRGVKPNGIRRIAMGEHELSSSFPHQPLATSEAFRSELDGSKAEFSSKRCDPLRKESERQRMRGRNAQWLNRRWQRGSRIRARFVDLATQRFCPGQQSPPRLGQRQGARATLKQRASGPLLQCADTSAESRLRNVAASGGARKAAAFRQSYEIGKPVQIQANSSPRRFGHRAMTDRHWIAIGEWDQVTRLCAPGACRFPSGDVEN